ncbi:MAG TPA: hypothetical protein VF064_12295 [Pyrinomonadaceae bacterium]
MLKRFSRRCLVIAALAGAVLFPAAAHAQRRDANRCRVGINGHQHHQQARIRQGVRSGELTRRETARLQAEQARIRVQEAFARRSGGEFTLRERRRIAHEQQQASRHIYRQKHDGQDRN